MTKTQAQPIDPILVSNVILLGIFVLLLSFYIIQANMIAADKFRTGALKEKLASLNEVKTSLAAEMSGTEDPSELAEFARERGMVQALNVIYVFENGNVALRP